MSAALDYQVAGDAGYTGNIGFDLSPSDQTDWAKMAPYTVAPSGAPAEAVPWWQSLISYGVTRAIDNTMPGQHTGIQGNTSPGSFAGQNGRTYNQVGGVNAPPTVGGMARSIAGMSPIMLALIAAGLFFALRK